MTTTPRIVFYRWHQADAPAFSADNAWSAPWGMTFNEDGSQYQCLACDGTGTTADPEPCGTCDMEGCHRCDDGWHTTCHDCDEGWVDCDRGYSCTRSAADLAEYLRQHAGGAPADTHGTVIVIAGEHVGDGCDGEPLAVPTRIVERLTWTQFAAKHLR